MYSECNNQPHIEHTLYILAYMQRSDLIIMSDDIYKLFLKSSMIFIDLKDFMI